MKRETMAVLLEILDPSETTCENWRQCYGARVKVTIDGQIVESQVTKQVREELATLRNMGYQPLAPGCVSN
jgi:hypothetical protein